MESAFKYCSNLIINASDTPDLSQVTDMSYMFMNCDSFNQSINNWDVSNVTNMDHLFYFAASYNQPLNNWDVSNVTSMRSMFLLVSAFNQNINNWDVSNVTNMAYMFNGATSFNEPLNNRDVSNVIAMNFIFFKATSFNQPLNNWNVSNVGTFGHGFYNATAYNQSLSNWNITASSLFSFLDNSGLSTRNYDNFLSQLVALGLQKINLGAMGLEYCNTATRNELINNRGWNISGDIQSQNCNSIIGQVTYDENNNGCDPNDAGATGFIVDATDDTDNWQTFSNNGNYELGVIGNNFTVSVMNIPNYYSITPVNIPVTFTNSNSQTADFCLTSNQIIDDLNLTLIPKGIARPG